MTASKRMQDARKASSSELGKHLVTADGPHVVSVALPSQLNPDTRSSVWDLFETNMHDLYAHSSFGWDPSSKKLELFDPESRFILVRSASTHELVAYSMFRFDDEDDEDVIYCYELQVSQRVRRCGLGKLLMQQLAIIGSKWGMEKVVLTVFRANVDALNFYQSLGFSIDPNSPGYKDASDDPNDEAEADYEILSKELNNREK